MYMGFSYTILSLKQKLQRTFSLSMGKSLRFTIPNSKINDKSKSSWWSIHSAPKSFLCIRFSESRILTLGHPHKRCRISLVHERSSDNPLVLQAERNIYRIFTTLRFSYAPKKTFADTSFLLQKDSTWSLLVPGSVGCRHTWNYAAFKFLVFHSIILLG